jgi:hypothetical protein
MKDRSVTYRLRAYLDDIALTHGDLTAKQAVILRDKLTADGWRVFARAEYIVLPDELDEAAKETQG